MPVSLIVESFLMIFILLFFTAFLFSKGRHIYSNVLLGIYLISQILGIGNYCLLFLKEYFNPKYVHLFYIGASIVFVWVPLYYLFICSLVDTRFRIKSYSWLHFLPFLLVLFILFRQFKPLGSDAELKLFENSSGFIKVAKTLDILFSIQVVIYNIAAVVRYYAYRRKVKRLTNINPEYDTWIRLAIFTFLFACIITIAGKVLSHFNISLGFKSYHLSNIAFLLFYSLLFFVSITSPVLVHKEGKKGKYWYSNLSGFEARELMIKLDDYMKETQIYRRPKLNLKELASGMGLTERHLSQVINDVNSQNFYDFINSYRVDHAKRLLMENIDNRWTMFDIFWESGFNSKTTFNTSFKKITGRTPTEYQKALPVT